MGLGTDLLGLVTSVVENERIVTTVPKAKAAKPLVEKMIALAKKDTLHSRRLAAAFLQTSESKKKLFDKLGSRFGQRNGGYTRVVRLGRRKVDAADRAKRREERLQAIKQSREDEYRRVLK